MTAYFAAFQRPGSRWDPGKGAREQALWADHARHVDALFEKGVIVLAGPFADRSGSLVIVEAESASEVRQMFRNDPWAIHDILRIADVREWTIFLDARQAR